jgi:hypothetical protein
VVGGVGGYVSLNHFVLRFTTMHVGVCGAIWLNISGICSVLVASFICWLYVAAPMGMFLWCM